MIWRWFWREWKTPSLIIVYLALSLAVAAVLALGSLGDRLDQRLNTYSREFLAGDLVLRGSRPAEADWLAQASSSKLKVSRQLAFQTMSYASDDLEATPLLVSVKATDQSYPLYGELVTEPKGLQVKPGFAIVANDLLARSDLKVGDSFFVGDASFIIQGVIVLEPDAGFSGLQTAPKVIIHLDDVEKTGAVQLGSRLTYRYMFAGESSAIKSFADYLEPLLSSGYRLTGEGESSGTLNRTVERAAQFLILCTILTLLLAAAAVSVAMTHYTRSRYKLIAILKTLGATYKTLRRWIIGQWIVLLVISMITGSIIGLASEQLLLFLLRDLLPEDLPTASIWPWIWAVSSVLVISLLVGIRPYVQLLVTQPIRVLRQSTLTPYWPLKIYLPIVLLGCIALLYLLVGTNLIVWSVILGMIVLSAILGLVGWGLLKGLKRVQTSGLAIKLAINRLLHQPAITFSQLAAFSISFMLLSLLIAMRGDLLSRWQQQLPLETPNYFLMNIAEQQKPAISEFFQTAEAAHLDDYFPIVLGRITELNDKPAKEVVGERAEKIESLNREINLTQTNQLPSSNELIKGNWPPKAGEVSIEQGVSEQLGLGIGDRISFDSGGRVFSAEISSIRKVDWESMQLNFYFLFPEGDLTQYTKMWITTLRIDESTSIEKNSTGTIEANNSNNQPVNSTALMAKFSRTFPTVSVIDVSYLLTQAQSVLKQVGGALQLMAGLVLFCGVLLMFAQVQVTLRTRHIELVVYRTLGASNKVLNRTIWYEFLLLGLVSGVVAVFGAELALWSLQRFVFDFPWQPNVMLWIFTPISASVLLMLCGWFLSRRLVNQQNQLRGINL